MYFNLKNFTNKNITIQNKNSDQFFHKSDEFNHGGNPNPITEKNCWKNSFH